MILRIPPEIAAAIQAWLGELVEDPPTAHEESARLRIVEMLWVMYMENPDSVGPVGTQPRDTWDAMLGAPREEMVAAGVAAIWP